MALDNNTPNNSRKRALTGIRASGNVHLGNYFGAIKPALELQESHECFFFIADLHALNTVRDGEALRKSALDIAATWIAFGFNTKNNFIYRQSDIPYVTELMWMLGCCTGMGLLQRAHAYKDATASGNEVNFGVFAYPVLMAADILLYDADIVPVGKDQAQHLDITRDIASSFNALYPDSLKLPQPLVKEDIVTVPGLDGRKMSKSYHNEIPLLCSEKELLKKIKSITTDSTGLEESKELDGTIVGDIHKLFTKDSQYNDLKNRLSNGGMGWGHAKMELFEVVNSYLKPFRDKYSEIRADELYLESELENGMNKAKYTAFRTLNRIKNNVGFL